MSFFASKREQRLWLWTLAIIVAIYATLGFAPKLAGALREQGLLEAAFGVALLLVIATVVAQALRLRPRGLEVAVALGVAACYMLVFVRMAVPEERTHLIEYGVVGLFIHEALIERARHGRRVLAPPVLAIVATALVGALDEGIQAVLPSRVFDLRDIVFNFLGGAMAVGASVALAWARRRRAAPPDP